MSEPILSSKRFEAPRPRRDFLGMAAIVSSIGALAMALLGALRLPMPAVFPESSSRLKLGRPSLFPVGSSRFLQEHSLWVFRDERGFYAISAVCTHLGCIAVRTADGGYECPCHGSKFAEDGGVLGGPAPRGLIWIELGLSPEGQLVADKLNEVEPGTFFQVA